MIKFVLRAAREEPLMVLTEPVFVGFWSIFCVPQVALKFLKSCSEKREVLIQSYLYLGENEAKMWSSVTNNKV